MEFLSPGLVSLQIADLNRPDLADKKSNLVFIILICYMVNELTRAVNLFTGYSPARQQPIKLEKIAIGAPVDA